MEREIINLDHGVSIEVLPADRQIYIARIHESENDQYGSNWGSSIILEIDGAVCYAHAGISKSEQGFSIKKLREIITFLRSKGVKSIRYSRINMGKVSGHELVI